MPAPPLPPDSILPLLVGTTYSPVRFLGHGGMGQVWVVVHQRLGRHFALKVLHAYQSQSRFTDRFRVEAETLGRLAHPCIVEVVDFWQAEDGRPCIIMELLKGWTVAEEILSRGSLHVREAVQITRQALSALGAAHDLGIVHRDIKPENLFLHDAPGYGRVVKVLDFGIARVMPELPGGSAPPIMPAAVRTATGVLLGSPRFMSPEAVRRQPVDHRADIYGIGLVLYEMLVGRGPFDRGQSEPDPPSARASAVPQELDAVVLRALRESPDDRFQSAQDFSAALKPFRSRRRGSD